MKRYLISLLFSTLATASDARENTPYAHLPTLAYVTPWNPSGTKMTEKYRDRLDMVSPVWYTVHTSTTTYTISGGPPSPSDAEWVKRLQTGPKPVRITPRFLLDGWTQQDYRDLLFNSTRAELLASTLVAVVQEKAYDGLIFESGATAFLGPALTPLSDALREAAKVLVLVLPPLLASAPGDAHAAEHAIHLRRAAADLRPVADFLTVMTYDMTGPGGVACEGGRCPAANSDAEWVRENLKALAEAAGAVRTGLSDFAGLEDDDDGFGFRASFETTGKSAAMPKLLMGFPLYGYKYPITSNSVLRGAGEPFVMSELAAEHAAARAAGGVQMTDGGEEYFEYEREDGLWRAYVQGEESVKRVKAAITVVLAGFDGLEAGLALWEMGQPTEELLDWV